MHVRARAVVGALTCLASAWRDTRTHCLPLVRPPARCAVCARMAGRRPTWFSIRSLALHASGRHAWAHMREPETPEQARRPAQRPCIPAHSLPAYLRTLCLHTCAPSACVRAEYGNTSAGSIPLALDAAVRDGSIKKGDVVGAL